MYTYAFHSWQTCCLALESTSTLSRETTDKITSQTSLRRHLPQAAEAPNLPEHRSQGELLLSTVSSLAACIATITQMLLKQTLTTRYPQLRKLLSHDILTCHFLVCSVGPRNSKSHLNIKDKCFPPLTRGYTTPLPQVTASSPWVFTD